jgi:hypothetical protein
MSEPLCGWHFVVRLCALLRLEKEIGTQRLYCHNLSVTTNSTFEAKTLPVGCRRAGTSERARDMTQYASQRWRAPATIFIFLLDLLSNVAEDLPAGMGLPVSCHARRLPFDWKLKCPLQACMRTPSPESGQARTRFPRLPCWFIENVLMNACLLLFICRDLETYNSSVDHSTSKLELPDCKHSRLQCFT